MPIRYAGRRIGRDRGGSGVFIGGNWDAAEQAVNAWQAGFDRRAEQARELATRMAGITASGRAADGRVEVTIGRSGELIRLHLDEETRGQSAAQTARDILTATASAREDLARKVADAVDETVGSDTETGRAILAGYRRQR
jgi:DNA-binding protein YbaB